jgi:hypothetical protein
MDAQAVIGNRCSLFSSGPFFSQITDYRRSPIERLSYLADPFLTEVNYLFGCFRGHKARTR